jgi:SH3 domain-containing protein
MTLTADQYFQVSQGYALAAADPFIPPDRREAFAKKAEWFEFLGRREGGNSDLEVRPLAGELGDSERPRRSMSPPGTTLRLTGAALALIGTLLFTNALNLFGTNDRQDVAIELDRSLVPALKVASVAAKATEQDKRQFQPTADRAPQEELSSPSPPPEPIEDLAAAPPPEVLKVTTNARIRNGPSTNAEKIGTATLGTAIQVKSREGAWVQFVDSSSGKIGWIHSSLVGRR